MLHRNPGRTRRPRLQCPRPAVRCSGPGIRSLKTLKLVMDTQLQEASCKCPGPVWPTGILPASLQSKLVCKFSSLLQNAEHKAVYRLSLAMAATPNLCNITRRTRPDSSSKPCLLASSHASFERTVAASAQSSSKKEGIWPQFDMVVSLCIPGCQKKVTEW